MSKHGLQVIENDALVVLAFDYYDYQPHGKMTWVKFQRRLKQMGFDFSNAKIHSMLSRSGARLKFDVSTNEWSLTALGREFLGHVEETLDSLHRGG